MEKLQRRVTLFLEYCDDYLGYTLREWLREVKDIVEEEHCVELVLAGERKECREDSLDPRLYMDGELVLEGLPGEEGYLIEVLKHHLDRRGIRCPETQPPP